MMGKGKKNYILCPHWAECGETYIQLKNFSFGGDAGGYKNIRIKILNISYFDSVIVLYVISLAYGKQ